VRSLEQEVFAELASAVAAYETALGEVAGALRARLRGGPRRGRSRARLRAPSLDDATTFESAAGATRRRAALKAEVGAFIENDWCWPRHVPSADGLRRGDGGAHLLVTGPNMAGKSTFLRQNASLRCWHRWARFVPARSAHIGVVDRCLPLGAADDLARGGRPSWWRWWRPRPS